MERINWQLPMPRLSIRLIPNAKTSEIVSREGSSWVIRISAPPVDGKANEALIKFLAKELDCAPSEIEIVRGQGSRNKVVEIP